MSNKDQEYFLLNGNFHLKTIIRVNLRFPFLFVVLMISACGSVTSSTSSSQPPTQMAPSLPSISEERTAITVTPTQIAVTDTPEPTLTLTQAQNEIISLFKDNGGCRFPCIWGLQPGETNESQVEFFHSRSAIKFISDEVFIKFEEFEDLGGVSYIVEENNFRIFTSLSYHFGESDAIDFVGINANTYLSSESGTETLQDLFGYGPLFELVDYYLIPKIIENYGLPTSILIAPYYDEHTGVSTPSWIWFSIVLIYEDQGFLIEYVMPRRMIGDNYGACPYQMYQLGIVSWDKEKMLSIAEIVSYKPGFYGIHEPLIDYFKPLEEATTLTIESFTEIFKDPETDACVYTPIELWPNP